MALFFANSRGRNVVLEVRHEVMRDVEIRDAAVDARIESPRRRGGVEAFVTSLEHTRSIVDALGPGVGKLISQPLDGTLHQAGLEAMIVALPAPVGSADIAEVRVDDLRLLARGYQREDIAIDGAIEVH